MYKFELVSIDDSSLHKYKDLLRTTFPSAFKFTAEFLKWQYSENPLGNVVGFNAFFEDTLVAHYVTLPVISKVFDREEKGLLSLNTATHPAHQGKKLFTKLAEKTYEYAFSQGYKYVYGVANANSSHGFVKNLGFQHVAQLTTKVGLGSLPKSKLLDPAFERLWDFKSFNWRLQNPSLKYFLKGEYVYAPTGKPFLNAIMCKANNEINNIVPNYKFISPFKLYVGLDNSLDWEKSFFYDVPNRFKSSPLNFIFKDLSGQNRCLSKENINFNLIDFDGY